MALAPDANETNLRARLTQFSMPGSFNEIVSDVRADHPAWDGSPDCNVHSPGFQELLSSSAAQCDAIKPNACQRPRQTCRDHS